MQSRTAVRLEVGETAFTSGHSTLLSSKPCITPVVQSPLFGKLEHFLPALKAANVSVGEKIASQGAASVDVEVVDDDDRYIAMEVAITEMDSGSSGSDSDESADSSDLRSASDAIVCGAGSSDTTPGDIACSLRPPVLTSEHAVDAAGAPVPSLAESMFSYAERVHEKKQARRLRMPKTTHALSVASKVKASNRSRILIEEVSVAPPVPSTNHTRE